MEVVASAVEARKVVIREVEGGTADSHVTREVETKGVITREWVVQAVLQEGGLRTELAQEAEEAEEILLRELGGGCRQCGGDKKGCHQRGGG